MNYISSHKPYLSSLGLSVDPSTVRSGATWLLERQGSQGEWGELEMFPDLDQVRFKLFICIIQMFENGV